MLNHAQQCIRWHLYDIKRTLLDKKTVVKIYNQWSCGLQYLQQNILQYNQGYSVIPDLGVFTKYYGEEEVKCLRDKYKKRCEEMENASQNLTLPQKKRRTQIADERAALKAAQAILDKKFQAER